MHHHCHCNHGMGIDIRAKGIEVSIMASLLFLEGGAWYGCVWCCNEKERGADPATCLGTDMYLVYKRKRTDDWVGLGRMLKSGRSPWFGLVFLCREEQGKDIHDLKWPRKRKKVME